MSVRLIHAADLHLDSSFEGLGGEKAALRRAEQRALLRRLGDLCRKERADLLLLCGDLFDSEYIYAQTGETLLDVLSGLDIPVFITPGNHDWFSRRSPYALLSFPGNVHIFTEEKLRGVVLEDLGVTVWGAGYTSNVCPPLLRGVRVPKRSGMLDVLALHAEVGNAASQYCPVSENDLSRSGFDYAAFGHIHSFSGLRRAGSCIYAWPGCPEGRGFDECGEKGVIRADLDPDNCRIAFIPMGARQYEKLRVEAGEDPLEAAENALPNDAHRDIIKIVFTGECADPPDLAYLQQRLEPRVFHLVLADKTEPAADLWERTEEDTLTGAFLRRMRRLLDSAGTDEERGLVLEAVRMGMAALEGRELRL